MDKIVHENTNEPSNPFDFTKIKVVIKRPKQDESEVIYLDREWAK